MDRSNLIGRASEIADLARNLADELARRELPEPSFQHGLPGPLRSDAPGSDAQEGRVKLLSVVDEFHALLSEPERLGSPELRNPSMSMLPLVRIGVFDNFPSGGTSVQDLARQVNQSDKLLRRLLSHAATYHVFFQEKPDFFVHTAASRVLAENEGMRNWFRLGLGEIVPATFRIADALERDPDSQEPKHSGWSVQNNSDLPIFQALAHMPERASVFANAMMWQSQLPGHSPQYLVENFPWGSGDITVVDVGGGIGHIARALATQNPKVRCIVQDRAEIVAEGEQMLPTELRDRISFQTQDFFEEQQVKGADVYLLKHILHDWPNRYARMILKALIPALKAGSKVVLNERVVPAHGEAHYLAEREARDYDMYMLGMQNGQERTHDDWITLLGEVDSRFKLASVSKPSKSYLSVIEVLWEG